MKNIELSEDEISSWVRFGHAVVQWSETDSEGKGTLYFAVVDRKNIPRLKELIEQVGDCLENG